MQTAAGVGPWIEAKLGCVGEDDPEVPIVAETTPGRTDPVADRPAG